MKNKSRKKITKSGKSENASEQKGGNKNALHQHYFPLLITAVYFVFALAGILRHEMWRDEHQAWMLARDSSSVLNLFENLRYDGHPALWHLLLYPLTKFTVNPFFMQLLHILLASAMIFLFNKFSPFSLLHRLLFTFGYVAFFEYALISRSYALGVLLLFAVCALFKKRKENYLPISVLLFLAANANVYAFLLSLCIAAVLLLDFFSEQQKTKLILPAFIVLAGFAAALWQIYPSPDNTFPVFKAQSFSDLKRYMFVFSKITTAYFSVPDFGKPDFWNSSIFEPKPGNSNPFIAVLLLLFFALSLLHKPKALFLYLLGTVGLVFFFYYTLLTWHRYTGHLFIWLTICFWLAEYFEDIQAKNVLALPAKKLKPAGKPALLVVFAFSALGGIGSWLNDYQKTFSASKQAADFIEENKLDTLETVGATDYIVSPLAGILNKKIFYPERSEYGSFIVWDSKRKEITFPDIIRAVDTVLAQSGSNKILLVLQNPPMMQQNGTVKMLEHGRLKPELKIDLLKQVKNGIVTDEKYFIYLVEKDSPG